MAYIVKVSNVQGKNIETYKRKDMSHTKENKSE